MGELKEEYGLHIECCELLCVLKGPTVALSLGGNPECWEFLPGVCLLPHSPEQGR